MARTATTANAILGLLALRPSWSAWELRNQLRRNMRFFWPRAESRILAELKRLDREGLAEAQRELIGRRPRTTYSITPAGRRALGDWLETPPRATAMESEPLLRLLLGRLGTVEQMETAVEQVARDADATLEVAAVIAEEYLAGTAPFQDHVDCRAFVFDYLASHAFALREWAERTRSTLADWSELDEGERAARALTLIEERAGELRLRS
jgi:DNA-binding PadR family transcriptional regulator